MSATAAELLVGASTDFLSHFSPFNRMEATALSFLAQHAVLGFHPRGSEILTPEMGVPKHFFIIQRGKVHPTLSKTYSLEETGQAAYDVHRNLHQGKVGVLALAPSEGLGVRDEALRAQHLDAINRFRNI